MKFTLEVCTEGGQVKSTLRVEGHTDGAQHTMGHDPRIDELVYLREILYWVAWVMKQPGVRTKNP